MMTIKRKVEAIRQSQMLVSDQMHYAANEWMKKIDELTEYMDVIGELSCIFNRCKWTISISGIRYFDLLRIQVVSLKDLKYEYICKYAPKLYKKFKKKIEKKINRMY